MALRAIWQLMDRDETHKILYGPKRSWGSYAILWVTDRYINCHLTWSAMNYLLYYTQYLQICQTTCFCYCISKTKKRIRTKSGRKHYIYRARSILYIYCMLMKEIWKCIHPRVSYSLRATPEGNMILVGEY